MNLLSVAVWLSSDLSVLSVHSGSADGQKSEVGHGEKTTGCCSGSWERLGKCEVGQGKMVVSVLLNK